MFAEQESRYLRGPLLSSPVCEPNLTSLMQEIFLVAQNSDGHQLQQYAAWAVSFLRHHLWYKEPLNIDNGIKTSEAGSKSVSQTFSEDSVVMRLCLWLMHLDVSEVSLLLQVLWVQYVQSLFIFSGCLAVPGYVCLYPTCLSILPFLLTVDMVMDSTFTHYLDWLKYS